MDVTPFVNLGIGGVIVALFILFNKQYGAAIVKYIDMKGQADLVMATAVAGIQVILTDLKTKLESGFETVRTEIKTEATENRTHITNESKTVQTKVEQEGHHTRRLLEKAPRAPNK